MILHRYLFAHIFCPFIQGFVRKLFCKKYFGPCLRKKALNRTFRDIRNIYFYKWSYIDSYSRKFLSFLNCLNIGASFRCSSDVFSYKSILIRIFFALSAIQGFIHSFFRMCMWASEVQEISLYTKCLFKFFIHILEEFI